MDHVGRLWTTVVAGKHHQMVVFGWLLCAAGGSPPLQVSLIKSGTHQNITKNQKNMESQR